MSKKKHYTLTYKIEIEVEAKNPYDAACEGARVMDELLNWHVDWYLIDNQEGDEVEEEEDE